MKQQTKGRNTFKSEAEKQKIHQEIIQRVCYYLKLDKFEKQEAEDYQRNRDSMCRDINWKEMDMQINRRYATKSYCYKTFVDVIIPNLLSPYPHEIIVQVQDYIQEQVPLQPGLQEIARQPKAVTKLVKKIREQIKDKFELDGSDIHPYKKITEKINNNIKNCIKTCCNTPTNITARDLIINQAIREEYTITPSTIVNGTDNTYSSKCKDEIQICAASPNSAPTYFWQELEYFGLFE
ncbi:Hypothetical_protein [Hexamita inflata]|uniref:Hypothetical_protein n=1 Tax=Hexamita inflata TaxID=28002 RepID=A0AA86NXJ7_9EUKA|nr:Hypothetical protein HINF_LOCUS15186 [Hexamita inflata]